MNDTEREKAIELAKLKGIAAQSPQEMRAAWDEMCELINSRSLEQVLKMETEKGLVR